MANNKQRCSRCSRDLSLSSGFYSSTSMVNNETGKLPICKNCLEDRFNELIDKNIIKYFYQSPCKNPNFVV